MSKALLFLLQVSSWKKIKTMFDSYETKGQKVVLIKCRCRKTKKLTSWSDRAKVVSNPTASLQDEKTGWKQPISSCTSAGLSKMVIKSFKFSKTLTLKFTGEGGYYGLTRFLVSPPS